LLTLENTHNARGGRALSVETIAAAAETAHELDVPVHLDGARLFNAAAAHDRSAAAFVEHVDSVMCCLSKGLGAPVGSALAGSEAFIERANRTRKLMGGGMRQAGIVAAPALAALSNRDRLAADHRRAERLAAGLDRIEGLTAHDPETNIVLVDTTRPAEAVLADCEQEELLGVAFDDHLVRFCTHLDVTDGDIDAAITAAEQAVGGA
jgi:L-threonine aldolase (EC 4.1.2.5)